MAQLAVDLTALHPGIRQKMHELLTNENAYALVQAKIRQAQIAKRNREQAPRSMEGVGGQVVALDPYFSSYFKMKYGTDPIHDPEFRRWLKRSTSSRGGPASGRRRVMR